MSFKKSKLDLLVRVRYSNPLPAPPCPPKLLDVPTNPLRYTRPEFLNDIASDTPLPMIVDAECGMPLDLARFECLWEEGADDSELNPDPDNLPALDPKDQFLLQDPLTSSSSWGGASASGTSTPTSVPNVSWLRKADQIASSSLARVSVTHEPKYVPEVPVDISRSTQIRAIEATFSAMDNFNLASLKHPNKSGVTAVDSYEVLPDANIWANAYDLFKFAESPSDRNRPPEELDPRLDCAILRPMESDGEHFLAYYLTKEDDTALEFKRTRLQRPVNAEQDEDEEATPFHYVRDYEVTKVEQEISDSFLLVLDEGEGEDVKTNGAIMPSQPRPKGAYFKNIERKMGLRRKRVYSYDQETKKWHIIRLKHTKMAEDEERERAEALAEVTDPNYLLGGGDADAEGEVEPEELDHHPEGDDPEAVDPLDVLGD